MPDLIPGLPAPQGPPPGLMAAMGQARPNIGPAPAPNANPGNIMAAMGKISAAAQQIQEALPQIPLGSEIHEKILKVATTLAQIVKEAGVSPATTQQSLIQAARQGQQSMPMMAMQKMFPQPGAGGAPMGGPPPGAGAAMPPAM